MKPSISKPLLLSKLLDLHLTRAIKTYKRDEDVAMASYEEKMRRARNVVGNLRSNIESDLDKVIARGEELEQKREKATQAHLGALDNDYDALDGMEHDLDEYSNSAKVRPLNGGGDGLKIAPTGIKPEEKSEATAALTADPPKLEGDSGAAPEAPFPPKT